MSSSKRRIYLFDTTLRDGAQTQGVDFSVSDKQAIAKALDRLGVDYIEGGWPGANPTDDAFFKKSLGLSHAKFVAFGMTRRPHVSAVNDSGLSALADSSADSACIVGKAWAEQVEMALEISLMENLSMIWDSITRLRKAKGEAMFDAEHFFDGYKANSKYALRCLEAALEAGARWVVLCDTRGGCLPNEIYEISKIVCERFGGKKIGIHAHNDTENAVANSLAAVEAGVCQVQGTINGLGERCGNANIISLIPNLSLKLGYNIGRCTHKMPSLLSVSRLLDERLGWESRAQQPYVGSAAFAHKGGLHASAVAKSPETYEHISPEVVGNENNIVMSNQAGMTNVNQHLDKLGITMPDDDLLQSFLDKVKRREYDGFSYDGADASFELLAYKHMKRLPEFFEILRFRVTDERRHNALGDLVNESEATVYVRVGNTELEPRVAMGNGPVHAFDGALRASLIEAFPLFADIELIDYKVRILPPHNHERGTAAITRVLLESSNGKGFHWSTVGVSTNIIDASAMALCDSYTYYQFSRRHRTGIRMALKRENIRKLSEKNENLSEKIKELSKTLGESPFIEFSRTLEEFPLRKVIGTLGESPFAKSIKAFDESPFSKSIKELDESFLMVFPHLSAEAKKKHSKTMKKISNTEKELSERMQKLSRASETTKKAPEINKLDEHMKKISQANEANFKIMKRLSEMEKVYVEGAKEISEIEKIYLVSKEKPKKQTKLDLGKAISEMVKKISDTLEANENLTYKIDNMLISSRQLVNEIDEHLAERQATDKKSKDKDAVNRIDEHLAKRQPARNVPENNGIINRIDKHLAGHQAMEKKSKSTRKDD